MEGNRVNIYFEISEGQLYLFDNFSINDKDNYLGEDILNQINSIFLNINENTNFSIQKINSFKRRYLISL